MPSDKRARQKAGRQERLEQERKAATRRSKIRRGVIIGVVALVVIGSVWALTSRSSSSTSATTTTSGSAASSTAALQAKANVTAAAAGCPVSPSTRVNTLSWTAPPAMTIDTSKTYVATVVTTAGTFQINLNPSIAPKAVNNFVFLAQKGYYHCVIFHRVIPGFMDQTGDPTGTGSGNPGYQFADELPATASPQYPIGSVAMANSGANTNGSQFFIVCGPAGEQLPPSYSLFGQVPASQMTVPNLINSQGSTQGVPPTVTQRILSVSIATA